MEENILLDAETRLETVKAAGLRLHENWKTLVRRAWSIRLIILAGFLSFLEVVFSVFITHPPFNPVWFAALAGLVSMAAFMARLVAQKNIGVSE